MKQLIIVLTPEHHVILKRKAFMSGKSMAEIIRHWILTIPVDVHPARALEIEQMLKINKEQNEPLE